MPLSTDSNRITYQGNGSSAVFNYPWRLPGQTSLSVFTYNSSMPAAAMITPQVLNTHYTFSGTANNQGIYTSGGSVIFNSSPNAQTVIVLFQSSALVNNFNVPQNGPISSTGLNNELDYITQIAQRLNDQITRAVRLPDGLGDPFDTTLPADIRLSPSGILGINVAGDGFDILPAVASVNSTAFIFSGIWEPQNGGTGTNIAFTPGSVVFAGLSGVYTQDNGNFFYDNTNNRLGVGVGASSNVLKNGGTDLGVNLASKAEGATDQVDILMSRHSAANASLFVGQRSRGTQSAPTIVQNADVLSRFNASGFDGSSFIFGGQISAEVDGTPGVQTMPSRFVFRTAQTNSLNEVLRLDSTRRSTFSGEVRVNSNAPRGFLFTNNSSVVNTATGDTTQYLGFAGSSPVARTFAANQENMELALTNVEAVTPQNFIYHPLAPKAWGQITIVGSTATVSAGFNCSAAIFVSLGSYTVHLRTPMAGTSYCVVSQVRSLVGTDAHLAVNVDSANVGTTTFRFATARTDTAAAATPRAYDFSLYGDLP